jgi:hypothetical protein
MSIEESIRKIAADTLGDLKNSGQIQSSKVDSITNQHKNKDWLGRAVDWIKWKTALRRYFNRTYERLNIIEGEDLHNLYRHFLCYAGHYKVKNKWPFKKTLVPDPYNIWDCSYTILPMNPISFIHFDIKLGDDK